MLHLLHTDVSHHKYVQMFTKFCFFYAKSVTFERKQDAQNAARLWHTYVEFLDCYVFSNGKVKKFRGNSHQYFTGFDRHQGKLLAASFQRTPPPALAESPTSDITAELLRQCRSYKYCTEGGKDKGGGIALISLSPQTESKKWFIISFWHHSLKKLTKLCFEMHVDIS